MERPVKEGVDYSLRLHENFGMESMIEEILANLYKIEIPLPKSPLKALNSYVDQEFGTKFDY